MRALKMTMEDIIENPEAYGAPTLEQFMQRQNEPQEQRYVTVDQGATAFKMLVEKHRYFFRSSVGTYRCASLEEVQRIAASEGVRHQDLDFNPQVVPLGNGKCDIHVTYFRKPHPMGLILPR